VGLSVALLEWNNVRGTLTFIFLLHVLIEISTTEKTYVEQRSVWCSRFWSYGGFISYQNVCLLMDNVSRVCTNDIEFRCKQV
jgi:hypothetical protein